MKSHTRAITVRSARLAGLHGIGQELEGPTEILNVLIGEIADNTARLLCARLLASPPCLVHHDAVGSSSRDEGKAIAEPSHAPVIVEAYPRKSVAEDAGEENGMPV